MSLKTLTLAQVADLTGGRIEGDASARIRGLAPLHDAGPDQLGLLADRRYLEAVPASRAGALLVAEALQEPLAGLGDERPRVMVEDAHAALIPLLDELSPPEEPRPGVHPTAVLGERVVLGGGVEVGPYAVLGGGAVLGDGVRIGPHAVVGKGVRIGEETVLHPHAVLYPGTVVGRRCIVHAGARLGVDGFGYANVEGRFRKVPQVGRCVVGDDVEIGANTCLDRGSIGETRIGEGTKIDNLVHLAHNVRVGENSAMAAQVGVAGSTRIGRDVVFGGQAGLVGHIEIGDGAQISGQAGVIGDVDAGGTVTGYPARDLKTYLKATAHMLRLPEMARELRELRAEVEALRNEAAPGGSPQGDDLEG